MKINLYDVMSVVDKEMNEEVTCEMVESVFQGESFSFTSKEPFTVLVKHISKDVIYVTAKLKVEVCRGCSRCLSDVVQEYELDIVRTIDMAMKKAIDEMYDELLSESDEISYIEDCNLDVDMLVLDELYTILPMNILCKDDCKGICKVCGTNLNESTCNCDQTVPDPRMAVFSDIFNQFKEV